jgi:hypothetical protein
MENGQASEQFERLGYMTDRHDKCTYATVLCNFEIKAGIQYF